SVMLLVSSQQPDMSSMADSAPLRFPHGGSWRLEWRTTPKRGMWEPGVCYHWDCGFAERHSIWGRLALARAGLTSLEGHLRPPRIHGMGTHQSQGQRKELSATGPPLAVREEMEDRDAYRSPQPARSPGLRLRCACGSAGADCCGPHAVSYGQRQRDGRGSP